MDPNSPTTTTTPPTTTTPVRPSEDEFTNYFSGLPSQPRLVARTDSVVHPWTSSPVYRYLFPVMDREFVRQWRAATSVRGVRGTDADLSMKL